VNRDRGSWGFKFLISNFLKETPERMIKSLEVMAVVILCIASNGIAANQTQQSQVKGAQASRLLHLVKEPKVQCPAESCGQMACLCVGVFRPQLGPYDGFIGYMPEADGVMFLVPKGNAPELATILIRAIDNFEPRNTHDIEECDRLFLELRHDARVLMFNNDRQGGFFVKANPGNYFLFVTIKSSLREVGFKEVVLKKGQAIRLIIHARGGGVYYAPEKYSMEITEESAVK
jgi:hypothetical protein